MWCVPGRKRRYFLEALLLTTFVLTICLGTWGEGPFASTAVALAVTAGRNASLNASCRAPAEPSSQSLLVVLLDRSGSLTQGNAPTDPSGYSTSVTKALADLWPGNMAVIPFSGDTVPLPILGPSSLANPVQRADLKQKVQDYPIGGDTPLGPAMQEALTLLQQQGTPPGSRVIVITDGNPTGSGDSDGPHQESTIRETLIPAFCQQGISVSAFGLTIDPQTANGRDANALLTDIANGTGATYTNVTGPEDLAKQVIHLYATWQNLAFLQVAGQESNFPVAIDPFAQQVSFVTFHSNGRYTTSLIGPNNQPLTSGVQVSTPPDAHYEIDSLLISGPIQPGTYTINTDGDPDAQVYALVRSPLQIHLVTPTEKTPAYANTSVQIQAEFLNGTDEITPGASDNAQIVAKVTLFVNGRPVGPSNDIILNQQKNNPIFSGRTLIYNQPGELQIELDGTYRNVPRQSSFTLQLLPPSVYPPCCTPQRYSMVTILIVIIAVALILGLIAWLIVWRIRKRRQERPKPYGYVTNGKPREEVELEQFKGAVISSKDLESQGRFRFGEAKFELRFDPDGPKIIAQPDNSAKVTVDIPNGPKAVEVTEEPTEITGGTRINVDGEKKASFETTPGRRWYSD